jgi:type IV pilus assembly protein PilE
MLVKRTAGITLIELLIVMAIVAILGVIVVPAYQNQMLKTRRSDGKTKLMDVLNAQERFYTANNTYTTDLINDLNYPDLDGDGKVFSDEGYYKISAAACGGGITNCVLLTAEAGDLQQDDGDLTFNSLGAKTPIDKW